MTGQCSAAGARLLLLQQQLVQHNPQQAAGRCRTLLEASTSGSGTAFCGISQQLRQAASNAAAGSRGLASAASSSSTTAARQKSPFRRLKALLRDYKQLSKFKLSALVALTASAGFAAGSGDSIDMAKLAWTSLGTLGAAACANTLNQLYEVANDGRMTRTANRPLPAGRLAPRQALAFAALTGAAGLWVLADKANILTSGLGAANIVLYAGVYTPLKQLSVANTWVGAVVGAIPPLMGWAAATGQLEPGAFVLAAALFSWQMPHFLALAWLCKDDYMRGGFKMLPSIDPTGRRTAAVALRHTAILMPLGLVAAALQITSLWFAGEAALLAAAMAAGALSFRSNPTATGARKLFRGSLLYLPLLLAALAVHRQPNRHSVTWQNVQDQASTQLNEVVATKLLPEQLQPGRVWQQLQELELMGKLGKLLPEGLHWPKMRPLEERYAILFEFQRQLLNMKCPSRAYGDSLDGDCPQQPDTLPAAAAAGGGGGGRGRGGGAAAAAALQ